MNFEIVNLTEMYRNGWTFIMFHLFLTKLRQSETNYNFMKLANNLILEAHQAVFLCFCFQQAHLFFPLLLLTSSKRQ